MVYFKPIPTWLKDWKISMTLWVRLCALISGFILCWGVYKIRKFFKDQNAMDSLNTAMLWRHGLSFGLYLASSLVTTVTLVIMNLNSD